MISGYEIRSFLEEQVNYYTEKANYVFVMTCGFVGGALLSQIYVWVTFGMPARWMLNANWQNILGWSVLTLIMLGSLFLLWKRRN